MYPVLGLQSGRICSLCLLCMVFCLLPKAVLYAKESALEPLRLSFRGNAGKGVDCVQHAPASAPQVKKGKKKGGRPAATYESEHRPVAKRIYYLSEHRRRAKVEAYVRRPSGEVITPELQLGYMPKVSYVTPFGDGPAHGANSVYVVEQGVDNEIYTIRVAKWITMHHSCGWGHDGKFDKSLLSPQPLASVPFEIVVDKLWDQNFHLGVSSGDMLGVRVLSYGKPVADAGVTLSSEKGWSKRVVTDEEGRAEIQMIRDYYPPLWRRFKRTHRGEFLLTASYEVEQQGSFNGEHHRSIHYVTTHPWQYTPSRDDYSSYSYGLLVVLLGMTCSGFGVFFYRERRRKPYKQIQCDE